MPDVRLCIECASPRDTLLRASDRLVMNSLVQRAEYDLEHHRPEAHV
jgi:hypothetical protein